VLDKEQNILETKALSIGYQQKKQLNLVAKDINITLQKGQLTSVLGANGIGKSTLIKTLCQFQTPISGDIFLEQKNIKNINSSDISKLLSVVLTQPIQTQNLSVYELVALGRQPYTNWLGKLTTEDLQFIKHAFQLTETTDLQSKKVYELSDGQLQKVLITRALAQDTALIILDEPTTHLDVYHKVSVLKLLKRLCVSAEKTILFSTHHIDLALQLCDQIVLITPQKVYVDTPQNLISQDVFDNLFPKELIVFDKTQRQFKLKP